ncbi:MAG: cytochrome c [Gemmataceae bacterium]|nr:cytochrome c [Gemmataceae bacterium]
MRTALILATLLALGFAAPPRAGDDTKSGATLAVMRRIHGKGGLAGRAYPLLEEKSLAEAVELARQWQAGADLLPRTAPRKGADAAFRRQAEGYRQAVRRFGEAVGKEDRKAARSALDAVAATCKGCHSAHR